MGDHAYEVTVSFELLGDQHDDLQSLRPAIYAAGDGSARFRNFV